MSHKHDHLLCAIALHKLSTQCQVRLKHQIKLIFLYSTVMAGYKRVLLSVIYKTLTEWAGRGNQSLTDGGRVRRGWWGGGSFGVKRDLWHCSTLSDLRGIQQYLNVQGWRCGGSLWRNTEDRYHIMSGQRRVIRCLGMTESCSFCRPGGLFLERLAHKHWDAY